MRPESIKVGTNNISAAGHRRSSKSSHPVEAERRPPGRSIAMPPSDGFILPYAEMPCRQELPGFPEGRVGTPSPSKPPGPLGSFARGSHGHPRPACHPGSVGFVRDVHRPSNPHNPPAILAELGSFRCGAFAALGSFAPVDRWGRMTSRARSPGVRCGPNCQGAFQ